MPDPLTVRAAGLPELFQKAGLELAGRLTDLSLVQPGGIRERIRAQASGPQNLLAAWLNQVLFLFKVQNMIFCRFDVRSLSQTAAEVEGEGELLDPGRHRILSPVGSVSVEELEIKDGGAEARLVF